MPKAKRQELYNRIRDVSFQIDILLKKYAPLADAEMCADIKESTKNPRKHYFV